MANTKTRFCVQEKLAPSGMDDRLGMVWEGTDNQRMPVASGAELTVFAGGPSASAARKEADPGRYFTTGLEKIYRGFEREVTAAKYMDWPAEEWTRGGYSCPDRGQVMGAARNLYSPADRLVWAGEHTCTAYFGYMEAALQSGMHAASLIARGENIPEVERIMEESAAVPE